MDRSKRNDDEARRESWIRQGRRPMPRGNYQGQNGDLFEARCVSDPDRPDSRSGREDFTAGYGEATFDPRDPASFYEPRQGGTDPESRSDANRQQRERFGGRGPKGAQRSDERIRKDLRDALTADPEIDALGIEVTVQQGHVTLEGTVPVRAMKRAAEDVAARISEVAEVRNALRVRWHFSQSVVP